MYMLSFLIFYEFRQLGNKKTDRANLFAKGGLFIAIDWLNANQPQTGAAQQRIAFGEGGLWLAV